MYNREMLRDKLTEQAEGRSPNSMSEGETTSRREEIGLGEEWEEEDGEEGEEEE
jgi:hypothetical protein